MTLAEILPAARKLTITEKVKLIRILAEDLDTLEDIQTPKTLKDKNLSKAVTTGATLT